MPEELRQDEYDETQTEPQREESTPSYSAEKIAELLEAARKEGRDSGFAEARRSLKQKTRRNDPTPKSEPTSSEQGMYSDGSWRDEFDDAIDEFEGLDKRARRKVRDLVKRVKPEDIGEYVTSIVSDFGLANRGEVKPPQTQTQAEPTRRPVSDRGAPAQQGGLDSADPVYQYSQSEVDRIVEKYGLSGAGKILKQRAAGQLRKTSWYHGPKSR